MGISLLFITIVLLILVVISIFQKLKLITWILIGSYLIYLLFVIITDYQQSKYLSGKSPDSIISIMNDIQLNNNLTTSTLSTINPQIGNTPFPTELKVRNAVITREIQNRNATDIDTIFHSNVEYLYFHTIINNPNETATIIHKWLHNGQFIFQTEINLGQSVRWRCWSRITLNPDWVGEWEASVYDSTGNYLASTKFSIIH